MAYNQRSGYAGNRTQPGTRNTRSSTQYSQGGAAAGGGGYGTQAQSNYTTNANPTSYTQPAYSTQTAYTAATPKPAEAPRYPPQPTPPKGQQSAAAAAAVAAAVTAPPPPPPANPPPTPAALKQQPPQQQQPQQVAAAAAAVLVKQETKDEVQQQQGAAAIGTAGGDTDMDMSEDGSVAGSARGRFRSWNNKRGSPGVKITRKMRKRRQNARLRNILAPKNAMMVLHELHPDLKLLISEQINATNQSAHTVEIEIDGKTYRGHGMSKMAAKQNASENALKAVLLDKLEQNNVKINPDNSLSSPMDADGDVQMKEDKGGAEGGSVEGGEEVKTGGSRRPMEDDVPWGSLASFALFKLFSEWQSQGFQLPPAGLPPVFHKAMAAKKLPDDAHTKHPVQLLNQIRPGCQYTESREGNPPNMTFMFTVVVDGQTFQGVGSNKKEAKKECAKHALEALGVKYD